MNIALCGFMGAGKTSVGRELAKLSGMEFVDTDELIQQAEGMPVSRIFAEKGEDYFREAEHTMCRRAAQMENAVISTGGGAVTFERNVKALHTGAKIVFIDASFDVICKRVGDASTRPLFKNRENAKMLFNERRAKYLKAADYVVNGNKSVKKVALQILDLVK